MRTLERPYARAALAALPLLLAALVCSDLQIPDSPELEDVRFRATVQAELTGMAEAAPTATAEAKRAATAIAEEATAEAERTAIAREATATAKAAEDTADARSTATAEAALPTAAATATPTPTPTATPPPEDVQAFTDPAEDVVECSSPNVIPDDKSDILDVNVSPIGDDTLVSVTLPSPVEPTLESEFSFAVVLFTFPRDGDMQVRLLETHGGVQRRGRIDPQTNQVIPGTEGTVDALMNRVRFRLPHAIEDLGQIEVRSFHMPKDGDKVRCDEAGPFSLSG